MTSQVNHVLCVGFHAALLRLLDFGHHDVSVILPANAAAALDSEVTGQFARLGTFDAEVNGADLSGYDRASDDILALARQFCAELGPASAVVALFEEHMLPAARLRDELGIPGTGASTALLFRDKVAMKEAASAAGIPVPRFDAVDSTTPPEVLESLVRGRGRLVLKPKSQAASIGVTLFEGPDDLLHHARTRQIADDHEIEDFVDGVICHFDGVVRDGQIKFVSLSQYVGTCYEFQHEDRALGSVTLDDPRLTGQAYDFTQSVLNALGLRDSSFQVEAILTHEGEFVFLEAACRYGGAGCGDHISLLYDVDIVGEAVLACLGAPSQIEGSGQHQLHRGTGASGWLYLPRIEKRSCVVRRVHGLDSCPPSVVLSDTPQSGQILRDSHGFFAASGRFFLSGPDTASLEKDMATIVETYAVDSDPVDANNQPQLLGRKRPLWGTRVG